MEAKEFNVGVEATVKITVNDYDNVIGRYLEGGEAHGQHPYGLTTEDEILEHLAYNAVSNGVWHASSLDGWVDLDDSAAVMNIEHTIECDVVR